MSRGYLKPRVDETNVGFWEGARVGELRIEACADCSALRFPPRPMCPGCHSTERGWVAVSGRGQIWSFVVPHPPLLPEFGELPGYNVIVVALEEAPSLRMVGNLVEAPGAAIDSVDTRSIEIGAPVRVAFEALDDEIHLPRWVRA